MFSTLFSGKRKSTSEYSGPNRNAFTFSSRKKTFCYFKGAKRGPHFLVRKIKLIDKNIPSIFHGKINWQNRGKGRKKHSLHLSWENKLPE